MQNHFRLLSPLQHAAVPAAPRNAHPESLATDFETALVTAPKILLTATLRWPIAARLAIAFADMGCKVEAVCPRQHPASVTRAIRQTYPYSVLRPLLSLRKAITSAAPDLIIPCDDNAARHLHHLHSQVDDLSAEAVALRELIGRSLGSPEACAIASARGRLMALAEEEDIRIPETAVVDSPLELSAWLSAHRLPAVIKIDCTWGGQGVAVVRDHLEARRVFSAMSARPSILSAAARLLLARDPSQLLISLQSTRRTVTLQDFIVGAPANRAVACWRGQVLAGTSVEAVKTAHSTGPATVVRVIENDEMATAAERLVRRLGLSGLWGFDFVLQASTGAAYLIEVNPRATPTCHLALGPRHDLPSALYSQLAGEPPHARLVAIASELIAMFPGEWQRDRSSAHLHSAYHDIPWDEAGLVQDCLALPWDQRGLLARLWARLRPHPAGSLRAAGPSDARETLLDCPARLCAFEQITRPMTLPNDLDSGTDGDIEAASEFSIGTPANRPTSPPRYTNAVHTNQVNRSS
jgi:hypothetical protein